MAGPAQPPGSRGPGRSSALGAEPGRSPARLRQLRHALRRSSGAASSPTAAARLRRLARPHPAPARDARRRRARAAVERRRPRRPRRVRADGRARRRLRSRSARSAGSSTVSARRGSNPAAGALAAAIVLTRRPVLDFGSRAYVDIPYVALVLGALLVETRRPRAGAPVLALLAVAGLLRPEAWLFSRRLPRVAVARAALALARADRARRRRAGALGARGLAVDRRPAALADSARATTRRRSGAITGLSDVPATAPRRLGEILREPVLFGAAGGGILALLVAARPRAPRRGRGRSSRWPPSACSPPPACRSSAATSCSPPRSSRSSAAPARSAGRALPRADRRRRPWAWFGARHDRAARGLHPAAGRPRPRAAPARSRARTAIQDDLAALVRVPPGAIRRRVRAGGRAEPPPGPAARALARRRPDDDRLRPGAAPAARDVGRAGRRRRRARLRARPARPRPADRAAARRASRRRAATRRGASSPPLPREESGPCTLLRAAACGRQSPVTAPARDSRCARRGPLKAASFRT